MLAALAPATNIELSLDWDISCITNDVHMLQKASPATKAN